MTDFNTLGQAVLALGGAFLLGGLIGFERQWRQRLAGLRTNTLVALGAATFVQFSAQFDGDASPTRVAAQIVSGIGFLGGGIIFKEGLNVRGLNTAATLWCSAAVGAMCGAAFFFHAAVATAFIIAVNALLRPLVRQPHRTGKLLRRQRGLPQRRRGPCPRPAAGRTGRDASHPRAGQRRSGRFNQCGGARRHPCRKPAGPSGRTDRRSPQPGAPHHRRPLAHRRSLTGGRQDLRLDLSWAPQRR